MNQRRGGVVLVAFASVAAIYYGLRMGPTQTSPPATAAASGSASVSPATDAGAATAMAPETGELAGPTPDPSAQMPPPTIDPRCPAGMEFKDEFSTHGPGGAKGCVSRRADGAFSREGRWAVKITGDRVMIGDYVHDLQEGRWTFWYEQGGKAEETEYLHGLPHGLQIVWNKDGEKVAERHYTNGGLDGPVTIFRPDGRIIRQVWKDGRQIEPAPEEPPVDIHL